MAVGNTSVITTMEFLPRLHLPVGMSAQLVDVRDHQGWPVIIWNCRFCLLWCIQEINRTEFPWIPDVMTHIGAEHRAEWKQEFGEEF